MNATVLMRELDRDIRHTLERFKRCRTWRDVEREDFTETERNWLHLDKYKLDGEKAQWLRSYFKAKFRGIMTRFENDGPWRLPEDAAKVQAKWDQRRMERKTADAISTRRRDRL